MKIEGGALPHWDGAPFHGAKAALILNESLVVARRDRNPEIPWPGWIDVPGGGREGAESPLDCVRREIWEEIGLTLAPARFTWARAYGPPGDQGWFLVAEITATEARRLRLGTEGLACWMMAVDQFQSHPQVIEMLQTRLGDYLDRQAAAKP